MELEPQGWIQTLKNEGTAEHRMEFYKSLDSKLEDRRRRIDRLQHLILEIGEPYTKYTRVNEVMLKLRGMRRADNEIVGELPRYADYAERDNSTMLRRDPGLDYEEEEVPAELRPHQGRGQPEYAPSSIPEGQILSQTLHPKGRSQDDATEGSKNQPRKGWKWCKHCGYDGAIDLRDPSKPPVDTIPTEEGYILVQPKPGVNFLSDHESRDCPKYKAGAMYPCSKCSRHDRITFHYPGKCKEDFSGRPAVASSFAARRSAFYSKEPTSSEFQELGSGTKWDDDAYDLLNTASKN